MSEVSWLNSSEVTTTEGTTYKQSFAPSSNVLYWPSAYVGTTTNLDEGANRLNLKMFYPSAVLLWDGKTDVYMPIMALAQNTQKAILWHLTPAEQFLCGTLWLWTFKRRYISCSQYGFLCWWMAWCYRFEKWEFYIDQIFWWLNFWICCWSINFVYFQRRRRR